MAQTIAFYDYYFCFDVFRTTTFFAAGFTFGEGVFVDVFFAVVVFFAIVFGLFVLFVLAATKDLVGVFLVVAVFFAEDFVAGFFRGFFTVTASSFCPKISSHFPCMDSTPAPFKAT